MGSINYGSQTLTYDYQAEGISSGFNKINYKLIDPGIYDGLELSISSTTEAAISAGTAYIEDVVNNLGVRVETSSIITHTVSESSSFIVCKMSWVETPACYMDVENATWAEITSNPDWLIIGQCIFTTGALTGFSLIERSTPHRLIVIDDDYEAHGIRQGTGHNFDADKLDGSDLSTEVDLDNGSGASDLFIPSQLAVKTYVDAGVGTDFTNHEALDSDTDTVHGILQGTGNGFDADTVDLAHKSTDGTLSSNSDLKIPTEKAVKAYIDNTLFLPVGTILEFDGTTWTDNVTMPGWYACITANAGQGCPNLVDTFTVGCAQGSQKSFVGNASHEVTIASANLPVHTHLMNHTHTGNTGSMSVSHTHTIVMGAHSHNVLFKYNKSGGAATPIMEESGSGVAVDEAGWIGSTDLGTKTSDAPTSTSHTHPISLTLTGQASGNGGFANSALNIKPYSYTVIKIRKCS